MGAVPSPLICIAEEISYLLAPEEAKLIELEQDQKRQSRVARLAIDTINLIQPLLTVVSGMKCR